MIETQPAVNPLETPMARPSEIVRQWPDAMWGAKKAKRIDPDGHITFCAIGILAETNGFDWGTPDSATTQYRAWNGGSDSRAVTFVAARYGLNDTDIRDIYETNDVDGKAAAADQLERMGL